MRRWYDFVLTVPRINSRLILPQFCRIASRACECPADTLPIGGGERGGTPLPWQRRGGPKAWLQCAVRPGRWMLLYDLAASPCGKQTLPKRHVWPNGVQTTHATHLSCMYSSDDIPFDARRCTTMHAGLGDLLPSMFHPDGLLPSA